MMRGRVSWLGRKLGQGSLGGTSSTVLVCCHANGFCKEMWQPILERLHLMLLENDAASGRNEDVHALAVDLPGHGDSDPFELPFEMGVFGSAVLGALDEYLGQEKTLGTNVRVVGLGHSIGATSLLTAEMMQPKTFDSIIAIEPILLDNLDRLESNPLHAFTLKRKARFESKDRAFQNWNGKGAFQLWQPEILRLFTEFGLKPVSNGDGVELKCHPSQEADIYLCTTPVAQQLDRIESKVTMITSLAGSHVPTKRFIECFKKLGNPEKLTIFPNCSHFLPMEIPDKVAREIYGNVFSQQQPLGSKSSL